ncbi:MAG TPA: PQQ-binding-like beta-propeller repeat protein [Polyangiaceae bacterium]|nr:PQQ-binding-like beta-propeller repeat protein [Polyangiaceae bacterium]
MRLLKAVVLSAGLLAVSCGQDIDSLDQSERLATATAEATAAPAFVNWPSYGRDLANTRTNPTETTIGPANASLLRQKWRFALGTLAVTSTPAIYEGNVYFNSWNGSSYALNARTGALVWQSLLQLPQGDGLAAQISSSPAVTADAVYVTADAAEVFKLDRRNGRVLWKSKVDSSRATRLWSSPVVVGDLLIFGIGSYQVFTAEGLCGISGEFSFRGSVVGVDTATGQVRWRVYVAPPGNFGVSVWSSAAVDTVRKLAFIGTGQGYTEPASPLSDSLIAIRYDTGQLAWSHQFTADDVWSLGGTQKEDFDVGASPNLFRIGTQDVVGVGDKAGNYYTLDRDTGAIVWSKALTPGSHLGGVLATTAYANDSIYVASNEGIESLTEDPLCFLEIELARPKAADVISLDARTGVERWRKRVTPGVFGGITIANGVAYFTTVDGYVHALAATDGRQLWKYKAGISTGGGVTVSGGMLFVGTGWNWIVSPPGSLVAFELGKCNAAACPACVLGQARCCNTLLDRCGCDTLGVCL